MVARRRNISGASGATYEVVTDDSGTSIGVKIIISNIYGESSKIISTDESEGTIRITFLFGTTIIYDPQ